MKTRYALFAAGLTMALTLPVFGQEAPSDTARLLVKPHDMSAMMCKPTVDATFEGLHMKGWLVTQKQHKEMMKDNNGKMIMPGEKQSGVGGVGMKDTSAGIGKDMVAMRPAGVGMDNTTKEAMMAGTYHIGLELTDAVKGTAIDNASVNLIIESPSKKTSSVDLKPMMSHYGRGLTLDEKGNYRFTVNITVAGVIKTTKFQYAVQ